MVETLRPGVYVSETPQEPRILGTSTSTFGAVGRAVRGKVDDIGLVTSFDQYVEQYGKNYSDTLLEDSIYGFFNNGGRRAFIVRVVGSGSAVSTKNINALGGAAVAAVVDSGNAQNYDLITGQTVVLKVDGAIYSKVIGDMNIGRIIELLGTDLVKIGFDLGDKGIKLRKGMTLVSPAKYYWQKDGMERRIEDYELAMDYINKHPSFLEQDDKYDFTAEQKQAFYSDSSIFKKDYLWALDAMSKDKKNRPGVQIWSTIYYGMQILDVNQEIGTLVAKVIWKYPPWVKVRIQDKVYIKGSFGIER